MLFLSVLYYILGAAASSLKPRASVSGTASVYLNVSTGAPQQLSSGVLYGIPDHADQIPDHFYTDIAFKYNRAGGAQLSGQGWIGSLEGYTTRFQSALSNYRTTLRHGGTFILLPHDIWGADGTQSSTAAYPGDDGDWTDYDAYLTRLIGDMQANDMLDDVVVDIWNEPDLAGFWNRPQAQYLALWGRTSARFRADLPGCLITGPSLAGSPSTADAWWTAWAAFVATNGSAPDQYSWHMEGGSGDMQSSVAALKTILEDNALATDRPLNINEYAVWDEEVPSGSAWWIAQLERVDAFGLRGNWLSGDALHDFLAGLVTKPGGDDASVYNATAGGYTPTPAWQVYRYYAQDMGVGDRRQTAPTADLLGDVFAVVTTTTTTTTTTTARLLVGARAATGTFYIDVYGLTAIGLPAAGTLDIHTYGFPSTSDHYAELDAPEDLGWYGHTYSGDVVSFPIFQTDEYTAYAFEFGQ